MNARLQIKAAPRPSFTPTQRGLLQRKCGCGGTPGADGECQDCRAKRLQRSRTSQAEPGTAPPVVNEVLRSPGQPLDSATRAFMELSFGHDFSKVRVGAAKSLTTLDSLTVSPAEDHFEREAEKMAAAVMQTPRPRASGQDKPFANLDLSQVRVHRDARAAESARAVNARAYTVGYDLVFGEGQFSPNTSDGSRLLAHELSHVLQQVGSTSLHHLQRQEDPQESSEEAPELGQEEEADEDVEDGDVDVPGLDFTPDFDLEPHGPEPLTTEEHISSTITGLQEGEIPLGRIPTGKIKHIDVDQGSQRMEITFRDGQKIPHVVSTGRGRCGTKDDPCRTQNAHNCTPNGTFVIVSRGDASTKNSHGDAMAWFVGLNPPGRKGIGIHDSQTADGIPRSHGCVRVGKTKTDEKFAEMINKRVIVGQTNVTISGKAKTKPYPCPPKKKP
jgi:hypothetical protein